MQLNACFLATSKVLEDIVYDVLIYDSRCVYH